ncbi:hypothetical protein EDB81DRAFT_879360 [Dactylonectria macrodidyma]|uniref:Uncharacterized protein n=1 Tax=Dactylonectria macrodidyma TaxID=307937 RepID=A0A9P9JD36_9HYPO|nr:hypothetical protein EDB81DRAFT_879360 [Dactylonectria macrodidyma]
MRREHPRDRIDLEGLRVPKARIHIPRAGRRFRTSTIDRGVGEFEGSPGTVFTEADSTPVRRADEAKENLYLARPAASPAPPFRQQGFAGVEGNAGFDTKKNPFYAQGKVFTEVDSTPVSHATFDPDIAYYGQMDLDLDQYFHQSTQPGGAQLEGGVHVDDGSGEGLTQAGTKPAAHTGFHEANLFSSQTTINPGQQTQQSPKPGLARVAGGVGHVVSKPAVQTTSADNSTSGSPSSNSIQQFEQFQQSQQQRPSVQEALPTSKTFNTDFSLCYVAGDLGQSPN